MDLKRILKREIEVSISKNAQPVWFRIAKYAVLIGIIYFFWDTRTLWIILGFLLIFAIALHLFYRYKTKAWTKSYGLWNYEKNKPKNVYKTKTYVMG